MEKPTRFYLEALLHSYDLNIDDLIRAMFDSFKTVVIKDPEHIYDENKFRENRELISFTIEFIQDTGFIDNDKLLSELDLITKMKINTLTDDFVVELSKEKMLDFISLNLQIEQIFLIYKFIQAIIIEY